MICDRCKVRPAMVHFTEISGNKKKTLHFCEQCAREVQSESFVFIPQLNLHNFLAGLFSNQNMDKLEAPFGNAVTEGKKCPSCGLSEAQFAKSGLLGCGDCYNQFAERLDPVFRRLHGTLKHTGKVPERTGGKVKLSKSIEKLKLQLKEAVEREEFEKAAEIRDQIRTLEKELAGEGN